MSSFAELVPSRIDHMPTAPSTPPAKRARWADVVDSDCEDNCTGATDGVQHVPEERGFDVADRDEVIVSATCADTSGQVAPSLLFGATPSPERFWMSTQAVFRVGGDWTETAARQIYAVEPAALFGQICSDLVAGTSTTSKRYIPKGVDCSYRRRPPARWMTNNVRNTTFKRQSGYNLGREPRSQKENVGGINVCDDEWNVRLHKRCAAVLIVKSASEYVALVDLRQKGRASVRMPRTPSPNHRHMGKRHWETVTMQWRVALRGCYKREVGNIS